MMTENSWQDPAGQPTEEEVAIDYIKAQDFRVLWVDGAIGAITPNGLVHLALYAERHAIPRRQVFEIEKTDSVKGKLGKENIEKRISRGSIVREMACDIFLSAGTAENLAHWLLERVKEVRHTKELER